MIVVKFMGGLGNQMFQYALAMSIAKTGKEVKGDITFYQSHICHQGYELNKIFGINITEAGYRDLFYFANRSRSPNGEFVYNLNENRLFVNEFNPNVEFQYQPLLLEIEDAYCSGFWQNFNYFGNFRLELLDEFKFIEINNDEVKNIKVFDLIKSVNAVSIHIRRGDYLESKNHLTLAADYYRKAIGVISNRVSNPVFFVFSDDIKWVKEYLLIKNAHYIDWNTNSLSFRDMQLMSVCNHQYNC